MHGVGAGATAGWVEEAELGEGAGCGVGVEVLHWDGELIVAASEGPVEEPQVDHAGVSVCVVVLPGVICFGELLEDSALGQAVGVGIESVIVCAVAS